MDDNQLYGVVFGLLRNLSAPYGLSSVQFGQAYQQPHDSRSTQATVLIHKVMDRRYGFPKRNDVWDEYSGTMIHTEEVLIESTFQAGADGAVNGMTPSNILGRVAMMLQSDAALSVLKAQGIGILRITDIRQTFFENDERRFEADPSFDFVLTHKQVFVGTNPRVDDFEYRISRV